MATESIYNKMRPAAESARECIFTRIQKEARDPLLAATTIAIGGSFVIGCSVSNPWIDLRIVMAPIRGPPDRPKPWR